LTTIKNIPKKNITPAKYINHTREGAAIHTVSVPLILLDLDADSPPLLSTLSPPNVMMTILTYPKLSLRIAMSHQIGPW
jgi:hypothetical protein